MFTPDWEGTHVLLLWVVCSKLLYVQATPGLMLPKERTTGLGCIPEGRTVSYECTVSDPTGPPPIGSTIWRGTAFQCSSTSNQISLPHSQFSNGQSAPVTCGGMTARSLEVYGSNFTSQLSMTAFTELNGTTLFCFLSSLTEVGSDILTVGALPPPPGQLLITLTSELLTVSWSPPSGPVEGGVGGYMLSVIGEGCGCVSMNVSGDTTSVTCSGWIPNQTCSFEVRTLSQDCGFISDPTTKNELLTSTCDPKILGDNSTSAESLGRAFTLNGVIVYDGVDSGSTAYLICDEGYIPDGDSLRTRICLRGGLWSGNKQICVHMPECHAVSACQNNYSVVLLVLLIIPVCLFVSGITLGYYQHVRDVHYVPSKRGKLCWSISLNTLTLGGFYIGIKSHEHIKSHFFPANTDIDTPTKMSRSTDAVAYNNIAYLRPYHSRTIYRFKSHSNKWSRLPDCPVTDTSLVILPIYTSNQKEHVLHTIGGMEVQDKAPMKLVGKLFSLNKQSWGNSVYPPMNKVRRQVTAVQYTEYLIAAGGSGEHGPSKTVEILNLTDMQWSFASSLPHPVYQASGCICKFNLYILGGCTYDKQSQNYQDVNFAYKVSLQDLLASRDGNVNGFHTIKAAPFYRSTYATISNENLVAIGGTMNDPEADETKCVNFIHVYDPDRDSWRQVSNGLVEARCYCFAILLAQPSRIMVAGGYTGISSMRYSEQVEIVENETLF